MDIVFPFRILALENNFLVQFQIDVSVIVILFMCLIMQMNADLIGLTYSTNHLISPQGLQQRGQKERL